MTSELVGRGVVLLAGVVIGLFGLLSLLRLGLSNLAWTLVWMVGGILGHDVVLSAATLGLVAAGALLLPSSARAPSAVGLVVLGTVTLMAVPVLGRFGERPDNPTLLDRSYGVGWLVVAGIVAVGVIAVTVVAHRRGPGSEGEDG